MPENRHLNLALAALAACGLAFLPAPSLAFENVNMGTTLSVQDGHIVAHWTTGGFDHYNIRWKINDGAWQSLGRDGDKNFVFVTTFHPGWVYTVAVEGCDTHLLAHSTCTSWDQTQCGAPREPCDGPAPRPFVSGGGLCLDVDAASQHVNGGKVQVWACNNQDQQQWTLSAGRIVSLAGKCLDADLAGLHTNGGRVQVWDCNGSVQQHWMPQGRTLRSGGGKCLDVNVGQLKQNGGYVQVWDCNGAIQQTWTQPSTF